MFNRPRCMVPEPFLMQPNMMPGFEGQAMNPEMGAMPGQVANPNNMGAVEYNEYNNRACQMEGCRLQPVIEPCQEVCVERNIVHEVPHICPRHTKIINNHIYRHTYCPENTCSEENRVCNIYEGSCCNRV